MRFLQKHGILFTCALHLFFLLALSTFNSQHEKQEKRVKVQVHEKMIAVAPLLEQKTICNIPEPVAIQSPPPQPSPKPKPVIKKAPAKKPIAKKTLAKKPAAKKVGEKKATKPKKPSTAKKTTDVESKIASLMKESLDHLGTTGKSAPSKTVVPQKKIGSLLSENVSSETSRTYEEEVALYLKHRLQLPEYGEVKIKLTLSANGKVTSVKILSASSAKNRTLVETKVPKITFPPFDARLEGEKTHTFSVTLKSNA